MFEPNPRQRTFYECFLFRVFSWEILFYSDRFSLKIRDEMNSAGNPSIQNLWMLAAVWYGDAGIGELNRTPNEAP